VGEHLGDGGAGRLLLAVVPVLPLCLLAARGVTNSSGPRGRWIAVVALAAVAATAGGVLADRGGGCGGEATHGRVGIWRASIATARERPLDGFGSGTFLAASRDHQLDQRPRPTRFAHNLALEAWVELGIAGLLLVIAWYGAVAWLLLRAVRVGGRAWLLVPYAAAFPLANLLDWPWHLLGAGMLWAVVAGGLLAHLRETS
jgi:O-antigen ligase